MSDLTGHVRPRHWTGPDGKEHTSWEYRIELGKVDGERQRPTRGGFRTKKAAESALRRELNARENGTFVDRSGLSYADFLNEQWLPMIEASRRPTTHDLYSRMVRLYVLPDLGRLPLQKVSPRDIQALYLALAKGTAKRRALGARSLHNLATVVHGSLQHAVRLELIPRNPAVGIAPPTRQEPLEDDVPHWTAEQVATFLDHVDATCGAERKITRPRKSRAGKEYPYTRAVPADPMQRALWYVLANTGMRRGEACGLQWPDVDLREGMVFVRRSRVVAGNRVVESAPKTRRGRRRIAIDSETVDVLRAWRSAQRQAYMEYRQAWEDDSDHVFTHCVYFAHPRRYGVPLRPDWITAAFRAVQEGSGLPAMHLHGLRHSWATAALEAGEHLRAVADHLGHADTAVTDRTYTHTVRRVQDAAALRVAALISSKRGGGR